MQLTTCKLDIVDTTATVTFARPPVNAQNRVFREEIIRVLDALSDMDEVRAVILTGEGHVFSAGADIKERRTLVSGPGDYIAHNRLTREFFYAAADCSKPVIAAVNGPAIGAGFALALYCDIIVMSETAYASMPELDVGLAGGGKMMMDNFTRSWARLMYFTGRKTPAAELYRLGIISACVSPDQLLPEARQIASEIARKSPHAVKMVKRGFSHVEDMPAREAYRYEQGITYDLSQSPETVRAQQSFAGGKPMQTTEKM